MHHSIHQSLRADESAILHSLISAFRADPALRWLYPEPERFLAHFPAFIRAFGGRAFAHGSAQHLDGYLGAALWLPPGVGPNEEALISLLENSVAPSALPDVFDVFEEMDRFHPAEPHWHLALLGIVAFHQGNGGGSALLRHALAECDRRGEVAYLESSNARNISLYLRHGFVPLGELRVGSAPPIFPMSRQPVRAARRACLAGALQNH
jgi:GNAT superfamily N-acetyltransferase